MTSYIVLEQDESGYYTRRADTTPARTPKAALDIAKADADRAVAIPESAWHEFRKASAYEEVK